MGQGMNSGIKMLVGAALIGLGTFSGASAWAQEPVTTSLSAVKTCLCAQNAVAMLSDRLNAEKQRFDEARSQSDALTRQVEEARSRVNTNNRSEIDAFTDLLARRDAAARSFREEDERYAGVVARYNRAVAFSNETCTGRLFDPEEVESVKSTLVCPRP